MYENEVLEIFRNPPHAGGLQGASASGKYIDEDCGDQVKIYIKFDENERVIDARFKTFGGVASIVASSVLCSNIISKSLKELEETNEDIILDNVKLPEDKRVCATFVINALKNAIASYYKDKEKNANKEVKTVKSSTEKKEKVDKKEKTQKEQEIVEEVKQKIEKEEEKPKSKIKAAFDELFKAWED